MEKGTNKGGILADDMGTTYFYVISKYLQLIRKGLGKTIQSIATILSHPPKDRSAKATLIVAPTSLVLQVRLM